MAGSTSTRNKPASYPNALKLPPYLHPAPPPTPSLTSSAASLPTPYVTLPLPCLCPSVPVQCHEYEYEYEQYPAHLHGIQLINKPTALPYSIRVPFFTVRVRYWPRPASSAPALFILVQYYSTVVQYCTVVPVLLYSPASTRTITVPSTYLPPCRYRTVQHCASTSTRSSSIAWNGASEGVDIRTGGEVIPGRVAAGWQQGRQPQVCTIGEVSRYIQAPAGTYRGTYR